MTIETGHWQVLMERSQNGDRGSYLRLLQEISGFLTKYVRRHIGAQADVDDVVQETLLSIHRIRHTYDPRRPFLPWLIAIARRRIVDNYRARRNARDIEVPLDAVEEMIGDGRSDRLPMARIFFRETMSAADRLSPGQRTAFRLIKVDGLSLQDAAVVTGLSVGALKVAVHRAVQALRDVMGEIETLQAVEPVEPAAKWGMGGDGDRASPGPVQA